MSPLEDICVPANALFILILNILATLSAPVKALMSGLGELIIMLTEAVELQNV